jgi:hypothetical protein
MLKLYIGDVHLKLNKLKNLLKKNESLFDHVVFLGDYFDYFVEGMDGHCTSEEMAKWLRVNLDNPKYTFLMGNHDIAYRCNYYHSNMCGFTFDKNKRINKILTEEDWKKFKYFDITKIKDIYWVASHAGFNRKWWPVYNPISKLEEMQNAFINDVHSQLKHPWLQPGNDRGFITQEVGGTLWCDWNMISDIPNVRQIVGHTPSAFPRVTLHNFNIDTNLDFAGSFSDDELSTAFYTFRTM